MKKTDLAVHIVADILKIARRLAVAAARVLWKAVKASPRLILCSLLVLMVAVATKSWPIAVILAVVLVAGWIEES